MQNPWLPMPEPRPLQMRASTATSTRRTQPRLAVSRPVRLMPPMS